jgi:hypothetical protein
VKEIRRAILDTVSDDSYGLWELVKALRAAEPRSRHPALRAVIERELRDMLRDGLIAVLRRESLHSSEQALAHGEAVASLGEDQYWDVPPNPASEEIRIAATDRGRELYFSLT